MRVLRIFLLDLVAPGLIVGWLLYKYPETLDNAIPWIVFAVLWHLTLEVLEADTIKSRFQVLKKRYSRMIWFIAFLVGGCISILYLFSVRTGLDVLAKIHEGKIKSAASSNGKDKGGENAHPNPAPASDRNAEILKKLEEIQRGLPKDASAPPFLISFGPVLHGIDNAAALMFVSFTELSSSVMGNPIELEPANLAFYVGVLNQQSVPSMIQGYKVEIKHRGQWKKLHRLDTIGGAHIYWKIGQTRQFVPLNNNEFFDSAIYHKSLAPQGPPAFGWVLFRYPKDFAYPELKMRMTVYDPNGKKATAEWGGDSLQSEGGSPQGAGLSFRPAISVPEQQVIRIKPF